MVGTLPASQSTAIRPAAMRRRSGTADCRSAPRLPSSSPPPILASRNAPATAPAAAKVLSGPKQEQFDRIRGGEYPRKAASSTSAGVPTGHAQMPCGRSRIDRDATCRRSESRHCRRRRSARDLEGAGLPGRPPSSDTLRTGRASGSAFQGEARGSDMEIDQDRRRDENRRIGAHQHGAEHHRGRRSCTAWPPKITAPARRAKRSSG